MQLTNAPHKKNINTIYLANFKTLRLWKLYIAQIIWRCSLELIQITLAHSGGYTLGVLQS